MIFQFSWIAYLRKKTEVFSKSNFCQNHTFSAIDLCKTIMLSVWTIAYLRKRSHKRNTSVRSVNSLPLQFQATFKQSDMYKCGLGNKLLSVTPTFLQWVNLCFSAWIKRTFFCLSLLHEFNDTSIMDLQKKLSDIVNPSKLSSYISLPGTRRINLWQIWPIGYLQTNHDIPVQLNCIS